MKSIKIIIPIVLIAFIFGCDLYPKFEQEYSPAWPISGNYYLRNYADGDLVYENALSSQYATFIYSASFEPETYLWVNHSAGPSSAVSFVLKTEYNINDLSFNCSSQPNQTGASVDPENSKYITIEQSQIIQKDWPENDSIIMRINVVNEPAGIDTVFWALGHRSSGHEDVHYDDDQGN
jgi:hypothetical protein